MACPHKTVIDYFYTNEELVGTCHGMSTQNPLCNQNVILSEAKNLSFPAGVPLYPSVTKMSF